MAVTITKAPNEIALVKNQMHFKLHTDDGTATHIILRVWIEQIFGSTTFDFAFEFKQPVDSNGDATFRVEEMIKKHLIFGTPIIGDGAINDAPGTVKKYKISYVEWNDSTLEHVGDYFHQDPTGLAPGSLVWLPLDAVIDPVAHLCVADTNDIDKTSNMSFRLASAGGAEAVNYPILLGNQVERTLANAGLKVYDEIRIQAGVNVAVYQGVLAWNEAATEYYAWLAGEQKVHVVPVPLAPSNIIISNITKDSMQLDWTDNSEIESGFSIEKSLDGLTGWTEVGTTLPNVTTIIASGLDHSTKYYFQAKALPNSSYSNIVFATTLWDAKTGIHFDGVNDFIGVNNISTDSFVQNFAWSFWFKFDLLASVEGVRVLTINHVGPGIIQSANRVLCTFSGGLRNVEMELWNDASAKVSFGAAQMPDDVGVWHHFGFQLEQTGTPKELRLRQWIDAVSKIDLTRLYAGNLQATFGTYNINGNHLGGYGAKGTMDQFAHIINQDIAADIGTIYNAGVGFDLYKLYDPSKFLVYQDFDEGVAGADNTGIVAPELIDRSGNSHTGTLNNFTKNGSASNWVASI